MRAVLSLTFLAAAIAGVLCVPLPYHVAAPLEVQPRAAANVYVEVPGHLKAIEVRSGPVSAGDVLARLQNTDLRLSVERLLAQRADLVARIESIRQRAYTDDTALLELAQTQEALAAIDQQVKRLQQDFDNLTIRAPEAGTIVPPPSRSRDESDGTRLASWTGRPLDAKNVGAYLEASTLVCRIAQPGELEAILAIDQEELDFIRPGERVDLVVSSLPGHRLSGQIDHIAEERMEAAPERLAARTGGGLDTQTDRDGRERPLSVVYQASVPLRDTAGVIPAGATGVARIHAGYQPLAQRVWRWACRTFHFEM